MTNVQSTRLGKKRSKRTLNVTDYTLISRKVLGKTCAREYPNMGYDQYTAVPDTSCRAYFCWFPLALANIRT